MLKMISIAFGALVCAGCATCGSSDATFTCASWNVGHYALGKD